MFAQNYTQVTQERGRRQRRYDDIEERVQGAAARGKAPSRTHFGPNRLRFVDSLGRVYVLPIRGDHKAQHLMSTGAVEKFFDPEYDPRDDGGEDGGDDDDEALEETEQRRQQRIGQQLPTLKGTVFMYVWRPRAVPHVHQRTGEPIPAMPPVRGSPGDDGTDLVLYECDKKQCPVDGGITYRADVERVEAKRRSERGQVILSNVRRTR